MTASRRPFSVLPDFITIPVRVARAAISGEMECKKSASFAFAIAQNLFAQASTISRLGSRHSVAASLWQLYLLAG
jgi:hypothetical protein